MKYGSPHVLESLLVHFAYFELLSLPFGIQPHCFLI